MLRAIFLASLFVAGVWAQADLQGALAADVGAWSGQMNGARMDAAQVIANSNRLVAGYRGMMPYAAGFGAADIARNRALARQSFAYLAWASSAYAANPAVMQALTGAYGYLGGFYATPGIGYYPYAAPYAYAGANRLTRAMMLGDRGNSRLEADLQRWGTAWAAASYIGGRFYGNLTNLPDGAEILPPVQPADIPLTPLPAVDVEKLTPDQVGQWKELRENFLGTAKRVREARVLLEELSARLRSQNMNLNQTDAAAALMMQGFLEDAVGLIRTTQFEPAVEALSRAEYQRRKLRSVTGR